MKTIEVYEFEDLDKDIQKDIVERFTNRQIEADIQVLDEDLNGGLITEKDYYNELGCDKNYAETTAWFIPACYYEKHKKRVDSDARGRVKEILFTKEGQYIQEI